MTLKTSIAFDLAAELAEALDLQTRSAPAVFRRQYGFGDGAGAKQANRIWTDTRTLAASATEDLDLAGVLTDPFGQSITLARVKILVVGAADGNANPVVVGAAAANAWATLLNATGTLTIRPGGLVVVIAPDATGHAVTAGTGDLLKIANGGAGTSVTYDIAIVGAAT